VMIAITDGGDETFPNAEAETKDFIVMVICHSANKLRVKRTLFINRKEIIGLSFGGAYSVGKAERGDVRVT
jgi:hypothetical protein